MTKFKKNGSRAVKIDPTSILETIRTKIDCINLYTMVEDDVVLTLDLDDYYIYFVIEQNNLRYRLTTHFFNNTMCKQSEIRSVYESLDNVVERLINYTIKKTKLKGIPCNIKSQSTL